ncbi:MAG: AAA family ATPase [Candidatus Tectimicrobiota bacterium]
MPHVPEISFGPYRLPGPHGPLLRGTEVVPLPPKALAVLWQLVRHAGQVVTKEALLHTVWPETIASEGVLTACMGTLRQALGDQARHPSYIATVHRLGYRFVAAVTTAPPEASAVPPVALSQPLGLTALVGRAAEMAQLHAWYATALRGVRQTVFVTGEAGIGKTTIVEAFLRQLDPTAAVWIGRGQCIEHYGSGEAYLPLLDALGRLGRAPGGARLVTCLQQYAPTWLAQLPALYRAADGEAGAHTRPGTTHQRMLRELAEALEVLSLERPLILVLEDLHWSDVSTVEALALLARRREAARLLVLGTYRPVDLIVHQHPLKTLKQELVAHGQGVELPLGYLPREAVEHYMTQDSTVQVPHAAAVAWVYRRTAGHPLFMVQVLDDLQQRGLLQALGEAETPELEGAMPPGLQQLLEAQLERLAPTVQQVLEAASVAGAEFAVASVAAAMAMAPEAIDAVCEEVARQGQFLLDLGLVEWPDGTLSGRYGFRHTLYQEVLYKRLGTAQRARLHRRIGTRHEAGYAVRASEWAAELAMHFARGRDARRALQYWRQAGARALTRLAYWEAVQCWEQALVALGDLPPEPPTLEQDVALRLDLARVLRAIGHHTPMLTHLRTAETHAADLGDSGLLGRVCSGLATASRLLQDYAPALAYCQRAQALATTLSDAALQAAVHHEMGLIYYHLGDYPRAVACLQHNLQAPQEAQDAAAFGSLLSPAVQTRVWLVRCLSELGEFAAGLAHGEAALQSAEALNLPPYERQTIYRRLGYLHLRQGNLSSAIALLEQAVTWRQDADLPVRAHLAYRALTLAYALAGRVPEALSLLAWMREHPHPRLDTMGGEASLLAGEVQEAHALAQRTLSDARQRRKRGMEVQALWLLGETARHQTPPDVAAAATCYQQALQLAETLGMRPWQAHCQRGLGILYSQTGQQEQACMAFTAAMALYRAMDMTFWRLQTEALQAARPETESQPGQCEP